MFQTTRSRVATAVTLDRPCGGAARHRPCGGLARVLSPHPRRHTDDTDLARSVLWDDADPNGLEFHLRDRDLRHLRRTRRRRWRWSSRGSRGSRSPGGSRGSRSRWCRAHRGIAEVAQQLPGGVQGAELLGSRPRGQVAGASSAGPPRAQGGSVPVQGGSCWHCRSTRATAAPTIAGATAGGATAAATAAAGAIAAATAAVAPGGLAHGGRRCCSGRRWSCRSTRRLRYNLAIAQAAAAEVDFGWTRGVGTGGDGREDADDEAADSNTSGFS